MVLLLKAFLLGLIGGVIPGPVLTAVFTEILQSGFSKSIRIIMLAFVAEASVAVVSLIFFTTIGFPEIVFKSISIVGAAILIWIATKMWKITSIESGQQMKFDFVKILILILANGMLWIYWITICIPQAIQLGEIYTQGEYVFVGLVEIGWLLSTTLVAFIFSQFRAMLSKPHVVPILFKIFSLVFAYFAFSLAYDSFEYFRNFI